MALTRKFLSALGIDADKVDEIISAHAETVDGLKEQLKQFKEDAEKLPVVQKELDDLKASAKSDETLQQKYDKLSKEYGDYKKTVEEEKTKEKVKSAYRDLLKKAGVSDKRLDTVLKVADLSAVKLGEDGTIADADALEGNIKKEWADFITTTDVKGANTATPPENKNSGNAGNPRAAQLYKEHYETLYGKGEKK